MKPGSIALPFCLLAKGVQTMQRLTRNLVRLCCVGLISVGAALATAQDGISPDPGIQGVIDAGLTTVVDQTSEHDGVQITLQSAYADTQRIILRVKVSGDYQAALQDHMLNFVLRDDTGRSFSYSMAMPVIREDDELAEMYDVVFYNQTSFQDPEGNVEIIEGYLDSYGASIDLQLTVSLVDMSALGMVLEDAQSTPTDTVEPFDSVFTVPIQQPIVVMPELEETVNGVTIWLERVSIAPSETEIALCNTLPTFQDWQPNVQLNVNGITAQPSGGNLVGLPTSEDTERCIETRFSVYAGDADRIEVMIDALMTSVPDDPEAWEGLAEELGTFGIEAEAFPERGSYLGIIATPQGMTDEELAEIINDARENLRQRVDGPWTFEVGIP